ncbi:hypothetical protein MSG28_003875 [Choristoneura fumiferana]|uniref:Uncharacterized protein n=1 Tax=Choristoneura fumiferana TaxID=7141 RepID=A0ACC0KGK6_CHOFU|nr:hypothetical protein MSG28_003875 [Choristoneura fumiferana]
MEALLDSPAPIGSWPTPVLLASEGWLLSAPGNWLPVFLSPAPIPPDTCPSCWELPPSRKNVAFTIIHVVSHEVDATRRRRSDGGAAGEDSGKLVARPAQERRLTGRYRVGMFKR